MPDSILEILPKIEQFERHDRFYGKYRGTVADNQDPLNQGRIQAVIPEALGNETSGWAYPAAPYSGNGEGLYTVPPVGAGVWMEFEAGDVARPIWTGAWWQENQVPKDNARTGAKPPLKILRTEKGLMVAIDDGAQTITLSDSGGSNLITIKAQQGEIRVQAATKVIIEAPQIELTDGAGHPLVFGDSLLNYLNQLVTIFNTHLHAGELAAGVLPVTPAPPATPFPAAAPALLSVRVKTG